MLTAVKVGTTKIVTLDKDTDPKTQFTICSLPANVMGYVKDRATSLEPGKQLGEDGETVEDAMVAEFTPNRAALALVLFGVTDWSNLKDERGNEIKCDRIAKVVNGQSVQSLTDTSMAALDLEWIRELGEYIEKLNEVADTDGKSAPAGDDGGDTVPGA